MNYVDIQGFKDGKPLYLHWKRIPITDVRRWVDENPEKECFNTIQEFVSDVSQTQEEHDCPFYLDIDNSNLGQSHMDARKFVDYILSSYGDIYPKVWFSGSKGFHILIPQQLFGAVGNSKLIYHWQYLAGYFAKELQIDTIDKGSYTLPRLWRIENTPNYKSIKKEGDPLLYKIPLSLYELGHLSIDDIKSLAIRPRDYTRGI